MKTFKKPLGAIVFLSWMPLKYATVTSFSRPHLSRNSGFKRSHNQINVHFIALYTRRLINKANICKNFRDFE